MVINKKGETLFAADFAGMVKEMDKIYNPKKAKRFNVYARMINGKLCFKHFIVIKESDTFYGVYNSQSGLSGYYSDKPYDKLITSATTLRAAAKKAQLLEIGYSIGQNDIF